ncbi:SbmA/BacA-like family transporter [Shigella flexneri]
MGVSFINAIMTLIAFLQVLVTLSAHVPELPIIGHIPYGLVIAAAIVWSLIGDRIAGSGRDQTAGAGV